MLAPMALDQTVGVNPTCSTMRMPQLTSVYVYLTSYHTAPHHAAPHHTAPDRTGPDRTACRQSFLFYWLLGPNVTAFRRNRALRGRIAPVPGGIGNSIAIFSARVVSATEEVRVGRRGEREPIEQDMLTCRALLNEYYRLSPVRQIIYS